MKLEEMTKDERSLLLYLETRAVDHAGLIDTRQVNADDVKMMEAWRDAGFIQFGRVAFHCIVNKNETNWVKLSGEAMDLAHQERNARADRLWNKRAWMSTEEYRNG